jgi:hypothetical protein
MATRRAWVLNLDADLELSAARSYARRRHLEAAMQMPIEQLRTSLLSPEDVLVDERSPPSLARGLPGRAFCPTPHAVRLLSHAGAIPEPHPEVHVLRTVNDRAFAASLGQSLPHAEFVTSLEVARAILQGDPEIGDGWRLKRRFGMAGRGQLVVRWEGSLRLRDGELAFLHAAIAEGGVQMEPCVAIECEYAMHGRVSRDGELQTGSLVRQRCDARGAWLATERVDVGAHAAVAEPLQRELRHVAEALLRAGYFGPFGVDAYTYRDRSGALRLQPRSEVNARYSMGFATGFGRD